MADNLPEPWWRVSSLTTGGVALVLGLYAGATLGPRIGLAQPVDVVVSKPIEVKVVGTVSTTGQAGTVPPAPDASDDGAVTGFLGEVMKSATALKNAGVDPAKIPGMVFEEFVKGTTSEVSKKFVDLVSFLITRPFQPTGDVQKDREQITTILIRDVIRYLPPPQNDGAPPEPIEITFAPNNGTQQPPAALLERIRSDAQKDPSSIVLLLANTDTTGNPRRNAELAKERGQTVRNVLVTSVGLAASRVFVAELADQTLPVVTGTNVPEVRNRSVRAQVRTLR